MQNHSDLTALTEELLNCCNLSESNAIICCLSAGGDKKRQQLCSYLMSELRSLMYALWWN